MRHPASRKSREFCLHSATSKSAQTTSDPLSAESAQFVNDRFRFLSGPEAHERFGDVPVAPVEVCAARTTRSQSPIGSVHSESEAAPGLRVGAAICDVRIKGGVAGRATDVHRDLLAVEYSRPDGAVDAALARGDGPVVARAGAVDGECCGVCIGV